jgi:hypothetical protein
VVALNSSLPGRIFISYRRQETAWPAGRLYDVLVEHFPGQQVFKDVDNIDPGDEFVERIKAAVGSCDVLLALIGPQWLTMTDEDGQRRLDNPEDYVRLEIETALTRKIRVIPILVDEARIPRANELPATLAPLVRRNAVEINPITFDTKRLISTIRKTLTQLKASDSATGSTSPTSPTTDAPGVFISYRRKESSYAARLYDRLVERLGEDRVYMDVDSIRPGEDWTEAISRAVAQCGLMLVLIGLQWGQVRRGAARIDQSDDPVRLEVEAAFDQGIPIIPVLLEDAPMPQRADLPVTLARLSHLQAVRVKGETFKSDEARLLTVVQEVLDAYEKEGSRAPSVVDNLLAAHETPEVEQLYDYALAAFWTEQWDKAVDLLGKVLNRQPDYADAARKLELARRQQELANHYAQASAAADARNWEQAVAAYTLIADTDPDYRDTNTRLAEARHQQQLATLHAEARRLHEARQWAAVIKVGEQLQAIDPGAADPDGVITSARAELAADQQAAKLAADYRMGLRLIDTGRWKEAVEALERVTQLESTYQDAPALLNRARQELAQAAELAEQEPQRQAEEQARQEAKEKARREAEEHARQQAEEQPGLNRGIPRANKIIRTIITILVVIIFVIVILQLT